MLKWKVKKRRISLPVNATCGDTQGRGENTSSIEVSESDLRPRSWSIGPIKICGPGPAIVGYSTAHEHIIGLLWQEYVVSYFLQNQIRHLVIYAIYILSTFVTKCIKKLYYTSAQNDVRKLHYIVFSLLLYRLKFWRLTVPLPVVTRLIHQKT